MDTSTQTWQVAEEDTGTRLDKYLTARLPQFSRSEIQRLIAEGQVLIETRTRKAGYELRSGETVDLSASFSQGPKKPVILAQDVPLDILYEDKDLAIVNKPAGMVVHPAPGHHEDTLVNALLGRYPLWQAEDERTRPGIVHRLDRDTSGLLLVALHAQAQVALIDMMKARTIEKRYLTLVQGVLALEKGTIDAPIGRDARFRQQMTITAIDGREARTHFVVQERFQRYTLLLVQLESGRTHQIRVHFQAIKHPVVADPVYGSGQHLPRGITLDRQFLHATQLRFTHPFTGQLIDCHAPLPADLQAVLDNRELL